MAVLNAEIERLAVETAKALARRGTVIAAYVFGSHVTGRADEWSDIDVAAFMEGIESWDFWRRNVMPVFLIEGSLNWRRCCMQNRLNMHVNDCGK